VSYEFVCFRIFRYFDICNQFNRAVYGRTADIKRLTFHDIDLHFDFLNRNLVNGLSNSRRKLNQMRSQEQSQDEPIVIGLQSNQIQVEECKSDDSSLESPQSQSKLPWQYITSPGLP
jgi:hypothetical protein